MKHKSIFLTLLILAVLGAAGLAAILGLSSRVRRQAAPYVLSSQEAADLEADCILVLGCGVRPDGSPSFMLRDRLNRSLELYGLGAAPKLLMSGDHSRADYNEVGAMRDYAMARDVPSQDVFLDHAGFSTYESMYRARDIFGAQKVVIVSQAYHLYRAIYDARALGLDAWGVAAEDVRYRGQLLRDLREVLARCKDVVCCRTQPPPTFLGDPIPLTGDGSRTNG